MKQANKNGLVTLTLMILMLYSDTIEAGGFLDKVHVRMINVMDSAEDLQVHCKSKNDDLGMKIIPHGFFYEFKFKANIWGNTLFFCSFVFDNKLHWFNIYEENRDAGTCWEKCWWKIKEPGLCLLDYMTGNFDFCYGWNVNQGYINSSSPKINP